MLTAYQVSTGAYVTEDFELLCERCFDYGDTYCRPVSNYSLDEWQAGQSDCYEGEDGHVEDCECLPAVECEQCGGELLEACVDDDCLELQQGGLDE